MRKVFLVTKGYLAYPSYSGLANFSHNYLNAANRLEGLSRVEETTRLAEARFFCHPGNISPYKQSAPSHRDNLGQTSANVNMGDMSLRSFYTQMPHNTIILQLSLLEAIFPIVYP